MVATKWIYRFLTMASLFFSLYISIEAFSIAQSQIRIGIYSKDAHQGLIQALKHQNRPGGRRDPSIFQNFSAWKFPKFQIWIKRS